MKVLFLKYVIEGTIAQSIETQFANKYAYIYNTKPAYQEQLAEFFQGESSGESYSIVVLGYSRKSKHVDKVWLGKVSLYNQHYKLLIQNAYQLEGNYAIDLIQLCSSEFGEPLEEVPFYLFTKEFGNIAAQRFNHILHSFNLARNKEKHNYIKGDFETLKNEQISALVEEMEISLHPLAQRSVYTRRPLGIRQPSKTRSEFQRDRERITHSKSFRRTVDKAQIYTSAKGDHYRTRLSHTLEVSQIARALARQLNLNEDLTEAIALGHDIGHTPFGHEGERELNLILSGQVKLDENHTRQSYGGFKHNYQSIRTLNYLEEKYPEYEGLDISYQVLEGVLKHTKIRKCKHNHPKGTEKCSTCIDKCFDINEFLVIGDKQYLYLEYDFPTTLEGQIVAYADEIAQRGHDLDDGIASGVLKVSDLKDDFYKNGMSDLTKIIEDAEAEVETSSRSFVDRRDMLRGLIVPKALGFFMEKLVEQTYLNMKRYLASLEDLGQQFSDKPIIIEKLVQYSSKHQKLLDNLEKIITQKVINSQEVNCFDGKSAYVIRKLFKAYYCNPRQLPDSVVIRIEREIRRYTENVTNIRTGSLVENEINIYKGESSSSNPEEDKLKRSIFIRCVADFIGGMTDNFANEQFKKLYIP